MIIAFTICSNNYLAHAKTLGDSYLQHHSGHRFIIGLVDKLIDGYDYSFLNAFEVVPVETLEIDGFDNLVAKYNIMELNTAVKPSYFNYIFEHYTAQNVVYLDPDLWVSSAFTEVFDFLKYKNIVLTPHMLSPIDDGHSLNDFQLLRNGIFNLGFIALSNFSAVAHFLKFWHERVTRYGFAKSKEGMFYDQLWVNYVPAFYDSYAVLRHLGYNMANWNLHERVVTRVEQRGFLINNEFHLRFFHFSGYKASKPDTIASYSNRFDFESRPDVRPLFDIYRALLIQNKVEDISKLGVFYFPDLNVPVIIPVHKKVMSRVKRSLKVLVLGYE